MVRNPGRRWGRGLPYETRGQRRGCLRGAGAAPGNRGSDCGSDSSAIQTSWVTQDTASAPRPRLLKRGPPRQARSLSLPHGREEPVRWQGTSSGAAQPLPRWGQSPCPLPLKAGRLAAPTDGMTQATARAIVEAEAADSLPLAALGARHPAERGPQAPGGHRQARSRGQAASAAALAGCAHRFPDTRKDTSSHGQQPHDDPGRGRPG